MIEAGYEFYCETLVLMSMLPTCYFWALDRRSLPPDTASSPVALVCLPVVATSSVAAFEYYPSKWFTPGWCCAMPSWIYSTLHMILLVHSFICSCIWFKGKTTLQNPHFPNGFEHSVASCFICSCFTMRIPQPSQTTCMNWHSSSSCVPNNNSS